MSSHLENVLTLVVECRFWYSIFCKNTQTHTHTHISLLFLSVSFSVSTWPNVFVHLCPSNLSLCVNAPRQRHPSPPTLSHPSLLHLHLHSSSGESALMDATCLPVYPQVWSQLAQPASCDRSISGPVADAHVSVMTDCILKTWAAYPLMNFIKIGWPTSIGSVGESWYFCDYRELWTKSKLMEVFCVPCSLVVILGLISTSNCTATEIKNPKFPTCSLCAGSRLPTVSF